MIFNKLFMQVVKKLPLAVRILILITLAGLIVLLAKGGNL